LEITESIVVQFENKINTYAWITSKKECMNDVMQQLLDIKDIENWGEFIFMIRPTRYPDILYFETISSEHVGCRHYYYFFPI